MDKIEIQQDILRQLIKYLVKEGHSMSMDKDLADAWEFVLTKVEWFRGDLVGERHVDAPIHEYKFKPGPRNITSFSKEEIKKNKEKNKLIMAKGVGMKYYIEPRSFGTGKIIK